MPKEILDLSKYDGGMNNHTNPRDLEENELSLLYNGSISNKGMIRTGYKESNGTPATLTFDPPDGASLWSFHTDYEHDGTQADAEHLVISSPRYVKRLEGNSWNTIINLGSNPTNAFPGLVLYDGQVRFCDGSLTIDNNNQPTTETKIYYQFNRKYFNENSVTSELGESVSSAIIKPDNGQFSFNSAVDVTSTLRGYLGLRVDKKGDHLWETIDVSYSALDAIFPTGGAGGNWNDVNGSSNSADETQNFRRKMQLGSLTLSVDTITDTYGSSMTATDSELIPSSNAPASQVSNDGGTWIVEMDAANEYFYIPVTIGEDFRSQNYGSTQTRAFEFKIDADIDQDLSGTKTDLATNWAGIDAKMTYSVEKYDVNTSSWDTSNPISSSHVNEETDTSAKFIAFADDSTYKYRIKIKLNSFNTNVTKVYLNITSMTLFAYLYPDTGSVYYRGRKIGAGSEEYLQAKFWDALSPAYLSESNALSMKVAIPYDFTNTNQIVIRLTQSENNLDNGYMHTLDSGWITGARNKGWQEVIIPFSEMIGVGSPTLTSATKLRIAVFANAALGSAVAYFDDVKIIKDERGTWDGNYKFFYSWIYDRSQESGFFEFPNQGSGISLVSKRITGKAFIRELASSAGFSNGARRITGANIYFAEYDTNIGSLKYEDPFHFMKIDLERGVSHPDGSLMNIWKDSGNHETHDTIEYIDPPYISSFSINSGYSYSGIDHIEKIRFRDATVLNRRIYYGNVDLLYEKLDGETYPLRVKHQDRVYKSLANRPDIIPSLNYVDVVTNDGDEITALESYADRLLVFKKNSMLLINATKDVEYLEDTFVHKGVWAYSAVEKTDKGIAWANSYGAYFYDGEKVIDITDKKIKEDTWSLNVGSKPSVVYEPKNRHLIVSSTDALLDGWLCDLNTTAWSLLFNFKTANSTDMVVHDGIIQYGVESGGSVSFKKLEFDKSATGLGSAFSFHTRDVDFGSAGQKVDLKKVYVSYKGTVGGMDIKYRKDGGSSNNDLTGTWVNSTSDIKTLSFVPTVKANAKDCHSIKLVFNSTEATNVGADFEIHDISIVYRGRKVK